MTIETKQEKPPAVESNAHGRPSWNGKIWAETFAQASARQPWTLGFRSANDDALETPRLQLKGQLPSALRGVLFRNGPARHERGGARYGHRYDGDGMVQAFTFGDDGISHRGRYVLTSKYLQEEAAGRFIHGAFGTAVPGSDPMPRELDSANAANVNALPFAGELLALWEPGSAYQLDPRTLKTIGIKTWRSDVAGQPFSAHPKVEPDGSLWNFGVNPKDGILHLYQISASGVLLRAHSLKIDRLPPVHDFAVTERHLVFLLPPLFFNLEDLEAGASFAESCEWQPRFGMRVLTLSKEDWSQQWYDLPAGFLFHTGNAWEDVEGVIRLDYMRSDDPWSLIAGWSVMRGEYRHQPGPQLTLLTLDPRSGTATQTRVAGEAEFPRVDPRVVGRRYRHVVSLGRSSERDPSVFGYDQIQRFDLETGKKEIFGYGDDWLAEEHIVVPDRSDPREGTGWIVGTALDLRAAVTVVSVFDGRSLTAGPVAQARLPYALPLGLHGNFQPA